jgi:membrane protease YdiL (CAAX protease family)
MNTENHLEPAPPSTPKRIWIDRAQALFEVLLLSGLVSSLFASLPIVLREAGRKELLANVRVLSGYLLLDSLITFILLFLIMKAHGETPAWLGFRRQRWRSNIFLGLAIVPILLVLNGLIIAVFQVFFPRLFMDRNPLAELIHTPQDLGLFIFTALIAGGIKEEVQRAFILRRFQSDLGGAWLGLILWSAAFAAGHYIQGAQGVVAAGIYGLIFGLAYLWRGNLVVPIVSHAAYDTLALLGYWFFKPQS